MTEKIKALFKFCDNHKCIDGGCPLHVPELKCGRGQFFDYGMNEEAINLAYHLAFGTEVEEVEELKAQVKELKYVLEQNNDERSKIGIMFEETLKENEDLKKKVDFLSGQCEAYKYCISKIGGD